MVTEFNEKPQSEGGRISGGYFVANAKLFDYLEDNMSYKSEDQVQRNHVFAIVDEVDSVLIDEARTPLIISGSAEDKTNQYLSLIHI